MNQDKSINLKSTLLLFYAPTEVDEILALEQNSTLLSNLEVNGYEIFVYNSDTREIDRPTRFVLPKGDEVGVLLVNESYEWTLAFIEAKRDILASYFTDVVLPMVFVEIPLISLMLDFLQSMGPFLLPSGQLVKMYIILAREMATNPTMRARLFHIINDSIIRFINSNHEIKSPELEIKYYQDYSLRFKMLTDFFGHESFPLLQTIATKTDKSCSETLRHLTEIYKVGIEETKKLSNYFFILEEWLIPITESNSLNKLGRLCNSFFCAYDYLLTQCPNYSTIPNVGLFLKSFVNMFVNKCLSFSNVHGLLDKLHYLDNSLIFRHIRKYGSYYSFKFKDTVAQLSYFKQLFIKYRNDSNSMPVHCDHVGLPLTKEMLSKKTLSHSDKQLNIWSCISYNEIFAGVTRFSTHALDLSEMFHVIDVLAVLTSYGFPEMLRNTDHELFFNALNALQKTCAYFQELSEMMFVDLLRSMFVFDAKGLIDVLHVDSDVFDQIFVRYGSAVRDFDYGLEKSLSVLLTSVQNLSERMVLASHLCMLGSCPLLRLSSGNFRVFILQVFHDIIYQAVFEIMKLAKEIPHNLNELILPCFTQSLLFTAEFKLPQSCVSLDELQISDIQILIEKLTPVLVRCFAYLSSIDVIISKYPEYSDAIITFDEITEILNGLSTDYTAISTDAIASVSRELRRFVDNLIDKVRSTIIELVKLFVPKAEAFIINLASFKENSILFKDDLSDKLEVGITKDFFDPFMSFLRFMKKMNILPFIINNVELNKALKYLIPPKFRSVQGFCLHSRRILFRLLDAVTKYNALRRILTPTIESLLTSELKDAEQQINTCLTEIHWSSSKASDASLLLSTSFRVLKQKADPLLRLLDHCTNLPQFFLKNAIIFDLPTFPQKPLDFLKENMQNAIKIEGVVREWNRQFDEMLSDARIICDISPSDFNWKRFIGLLTNTIVSQLCNILVAEMEELFVILMDSDQPILVDGHAELHGDRITTFPGSSGALKESFRHMMFLTHIVNEELVEKLDIPGFLAVLVSLPVNAFKLIHVPVSTKDEQMDNAVREIKPTEIFDEKAIIDIDIELCRQDTIIDLIDEKLDLDRAFMQLENLCESISTSSNQVFGDMYMQFAFLLDRRELSRFLSLDAVEIYRKVPYNENTLLEYKIPNIIKYYRKFEEFFSQKLAMVANLTEEASSIPSAIRFQFVQFVMKPVKHALNMQLAMLLHELREFITQCISDLTKSVSVWMRLASTSLNTFNRDLTGEFSITSLRGIGPVLETIKYSVKALKRTITISKRLVDAVEDQKLQLSISSDFIGSERRAIASNEMKLKQIFQSKQLLQANMAKYSKLHSSTIRDFINKVHTLIVNFKSDVDARKPFIDIDRYNGCGVEIANVVVNSVDDVKEIIGEKFQELDQIELDLSQVALIQTNFDSSKVEKMRVELNDLDFFWTALESSCTAIVECLGRTFQDCSFESIAENPEEMVELIEKLEYRAHRSWLPMLRYQLSHLETVFRIMRALQQPYVTQYYWRHLSHLVRFELTIENKVDDLMYLLFRDDDIRASISKLIGEAKKEDNHNKHIEDLSRVWLFAKFSSSTKDVVVNTKGCLCKMFDSITYQLSLDEDDVNDERINVEEEGNDFYHPLMRFNNHIINVEECMLDPSTEDSMIASEETSAYDIAGEYDSEMDGINMDIDFDILEHEQEQLDNADAETTVFKHNYINTVSLLNDFQDLVINPLSFINDLDLSDYDSLMSICIHLPIFEELNRSLITLRTCKRLNTRRLDALVEEWREQLYKLRGALRELYALCLFVDCYIYFFAQASVILGDTFELKSDVKGPIDALTRAYRLIDRIAAFVCMLQIADDDIVVEIKETKTFLVSQCWSLVVETCETLSSLHPQMLFISSTKMPLYCFGFGRIFSHFSNCGVTSNSDYTFNSGDIAIINSFIATTFPTLRAASIVENSIISVFDNVGYKIPMVNNIDLERNYNIFTFIRDMEKHCNEIVTVFFNKCKNIEDEFSDMTNLPLDEFGVQIDTWLQRAFELPFSYFRLVLNTLLHFCRSFNISMVEYYRSFISSLRRACAIEDEFIKHRNVISTMIGYDALKTNVVRPIDMEFNSSGGSFVLHSSKSDAKTLSFDNAVMSSTEIFSGNIAENELEEELMIIEDEEDEFNDFDEDEEQMEEDSSISWTDHICYFDIEFNLDDKTAKIDDLTMDLSRQIVTSYPSPAAYKQYWNVIKNIFAATTLGNNFLLFGEGYHMRQTLLQSFVVLSCQSIFVYDCANFLKLFKENDERSALMLFHSILRGLVDAAHLTKTIIIFDHTCLLSDRLLNILNNDIPQQGIGFLYNKGFEQKIHLNAVPIYMPSTFGSSTSFYFNVFLSLCFLKGQLTNVYSFSLHVSKILSTLVLYMKVLGIDLRIRVVELRRVLDGTLNVWKAFEKSEEDTIYSNEQAHLRLCQCFSYALQQWLDLFLPASLHSSIRYGAHTQRLFSEENTFELLLNRIIPSSKKLKELKFPERYDIFANSSYSMEGQSVKLEKTIQLLHSALSHYDDLVLYFYAASDYHVFKAVEDILKVYYHKSQKRKEMIITSTIRNNTLFGDEQFIGILNDQLMTRCLKYIDHFKDSKKIPKLVCVIYISGPLHGDLASFKINLRRKLNVFLKTLRPDVPDARFLFVHALNCGLERVSCISDDIYSNMDFQHHYKADAELRLNYNRNITNMVALGFYCPIILDPLSNSVASRSISQAYFLQRSRFDIHSSHLGKIYGSGTIGVFIISNVIGFMSQFSQEFKSLSTIWASIGSKTELLVRLAGAMPVCEDPIAWLLFISYITCFIGIRRECIRKLDLYYFQRVKEQLGDAIEQEELNEYEYDFSESITGELSISFDQVSNVIDQNINGRTPILLGGYHITALDQLELDWKPVNPSKTGMDDLHTVTLKKRQQSISNEILGYVMRNVNMRKCEVKVSLLDWPLITEHPIVPYIEEKGYIVNTFRFSLTPFTTCESLIRSILSVLPRWSLYDCEPLSDKERWIIYFTDIQFAPPEVISQIVHLSNTKLLYVPSENMTVKLKYCFFSVHGRFYEPLYAPFNDLLLRSANPLSGFVPIEFDAHHDLHMYSNVLLQEWGLVRGTENAVLVHSAVQTLDHVITSLAKSMRQSMSKPFLIITKSQISAIINVMKHHRPCDESFPLSLLSLLVFCIQVFFMLRSATDAEIGHIQNMIETAIRRYFPSKVRLKTRTILRIILVHENMVEWFHEGASTTLSLVDKTKKCGKFYLVNNFKLLRFRLFRKLQKEVSTFSLMNDGWITSVLMGLLFILSTPNGNLCISTSFNFDVAIFKDFIGKSLQKIHQSVNPVEFLYLGEKEKENSTKILEKAIYDMVVEDRKIHFLFDLEFYHCELQSERVIRFLKLFYDATVHGTYYHEFVLQNEFLSPNVKDKIIKFVKERSLLKITPEMVLQEKFRSNFSFVIVTHISSFSYPAESQFLLPLIARIPVFRIRFMDIKAWTTLTEDVMMFLRAKLAKSVGMNLKNSSLIKVKSTVAYRICLTKQDSNTLASFFATLFNHWSRMLPLGCFTISDSPLSVGMNFDAAFIPGTVDNRSLFSFFSVYMHTFIKIYVDVRKMIIAEESSIRDSKRFITNLERSVDKKKKEAEELEVSLAALNDQLDTLINQMSSERLRANSLQVQLEEIKIDLDEKTERSEKVLNHLSNLRDQSEMNARKLNETRRNCSMMLRMSTNSKEESIAVRELVLSDTMNEEAMLTCGLLLVILEQQPPNQQLSAYIPKLRQMLTIDDGLAILLTKFDYEMANMKVIDTAVKMRSIRMPLEENKDNVVLNSIRELILYCFTLRKLRIDIVDTHTLSTEAESDRIAVQDRYLTLKQWHETSSQSIERLIGQTITMSDRIASIKYTIKKSGKIVTSADSILKQLEGVRCALEETTLPQLASLKTFEASVAPNEVNISVRSPEASPLIFSNAKSIFETVEFLKTPSAANVGLGFSPNQSRNVPDLDELFADFNPNATFKHAGSSAILSTLGFFSSRITPLAHQDFIYGSISALMHHDLIKHTSIFDNLVKLLFVDSFVRLRRLIPESTFPTHVPDCIDNVYRMLLEDERELPNGTPQMKLDIQEGELMVDHSPSAGQEDSGPGESSDYTSASERMKTHRSEMSLRSSCSRISESTISASGMLQSALSISQSRMSMSQVNISGNIDDIDVLLPKIKRAKARASMLTPAILGCERLRMDIISLNLGSAISFCFDPMSIIETDLKSLSHPNHIFTDFSDPDLFQRILSAGQSENDLLFISGYDSRSALPHHFMQLLNAVKHSKSFFDIDDVKYPIPKRHFVMVFISENAIVPSVVASPIRDHIIISTPLTVDDLSRTLVFELLRRREKDVYNVICLLTQKADAILVDFHEYRSILAKAVVELPSLLDKLVVSDKIEALQRVLKNFNSVHELADALDLFLNHIINRYVEPLQSVTQTLAALMMAANLSDSVARELNRLFCVACAQLPNHYDRLSLGLMFLRFLGLIPQDNIEMLIHLIEGTDEEEEEIDLLSSMNLSSAMIELINSEDEVIMDFVLSSSPFTANFDLPEQLTLVQKLFVVVYFRFEEINIILYQFFKALGMNAITDFTPFKFHSTKGYVEDFQGYHCCCLNWNLQHYIPNDAYFLDPIQPLDTNMFSMSKYLVIPFANNHTEYLMRTFNLLTTDDRYSHIKLYITISDASLFKLPVYIQRKTLVVTSFDNFKSIDIAHNFNFGVIFSLKLVERLASLCKIGIKSLPATMYTSIVCAICWLEVLSIVRVFPCITTAFYEVCLKLANEYHINGRSTANLIQQCSIIFDGHIELQEVNVDVIGVFEYFIEHPFKSVVGKLTEDLSDQFFTELYYTGNEIQDVAVGLFDPSVRSDYGEMIQFQKRFIATMGKPNVNVSSQLCFTDVIEKINNVVEFITHNIPGYIVVPHKHKLVNNSHPMVVALLTHAYSLNHLRNTMITDINTLLHASNGKYPTCSNHLRSIVIPLLNNAVPMSWFFATKPSNRIMYQSHLSVYHYNLSKTRKLTVYLGDFEVSVNTTRDLINNLMEQNGFYSRTISGVVLHAGIFPTFSSFILSAIMNLGRLWRERAQCLFIFPLDFEGIDELIKNSIISPALVKFCDTSITGGQVTLLDSGKFEIDLLLQHNCRLPPIQMHVGTFDALQHPNITVIPVRFPFDESEFPLKVKAQDFYLVASVEPKSVDRGPNRLILNEFWGF
ncbi:hypothetical protein PCE1_000822 [Barthelona sp. PCE]